MFNSIRKLATVILGLSTVAPPSLFAAADAVMVDVTLPEIVSGSYHGFCIPVAGNTHYSASSTDDVNLSYEGLAPSNTSIESFFTATQVYFVDTNPSSNSKCGASTDTTGYILANNFYVRR